MLIVTAPGQGAQAPGFLRPWLEEPAVAEQVQRLGAVVDLDLAQLGTEGDAETVRDTAVAQPLLVATGLAVGRALWPGGPSRAPYRVGALAGHSVGEITVAALAGVLSDEQAMLLVARRGLAMARAAAATPTGMSAVLGGTREEVLESLDRHGLTAANVNAAGQVVAAGTLGALRSLAADPPPRARVTPLPVAGAFHTEHMASAVEQLAALVADVLPGEPCAPVLGNADGSAASDGAEVLRRIVAQVARPVRWDLCQQRMLDLEVTGVLELPPAGVLTGIARRALPGVATLALTSPDRLDEARAFVAEHTTDDPSPGVTSSATQGATAR